MHDRPSIGTCVSHALGRCDDLSSCPRNHRRHLQRLGLRSGAPRRQSASGRQRPAAANHAKRLCTIVILEMLCLDALMRSSVLLNCCFWPSQSKYMDMRKP